MTIFLLTLLLCFSVSLHVVPMEVKRKQQSGYQRLADCHAIKQRWNAVSV